MVTHYYPRGWYDYAPEPHKFLARKWYADLGLKTENFAGHSWDSETRILTAVNFQAVTKTPPPWLRKER